MARQGTPKGSPLECSCVKLTPVLARVTARLTAASSAAREGLATRLPTSTAGKRLPKWHTHMVLSQALDQSGDLRVSGVIGEA